MIKFWLTMYEFTSSELEQMIFAVKSIESDLNAVGALFDTLEHDLKDYIGEQPARAFNGFDARLYAKINLLKGILFSKEFLLDL